MHAQRIGFTDPTGVFVSEATMKPCKIVSPRLYHATAESREEEKNLICLQPEGTIPNGKFLMQQAPKGHLSQGEMDALKRAVRNEH